MVPEKHSEPSKSKENGNTLRRQNPMSGDISDDEVKRQINIVASWFDKQWLLEGETNPLQQLWRRKDWVSTIELFTLGQALEHVGHISSRWVSHQVEQCKSDDANVRKGAYFELVGVNMLGTKLGERAVPTPPNTPGIDCELKISPDYVMRANLKSFGITSTHREFFETCWGIRDALIDELRERMLSPVSVLIISEGKYPTENQWQQLRKLVASFPNRLPDQPVCLSDRSFWDLIVSPILFDDLRVSDECLSYMLSIFSHRHKNEDRNIRSKLEDGLSDLKKAEFSGAEKYLDVLFVRIPVSVPFSSVEIAAEQLFATFDFKYAAGIILYQPDLAYDLSIKKRALFHHFKVVSNPKHSVDFSKLASKILKITVSVGRNTNTPVRTVLGADSEKLNFKGKYFFQEGEIFASANKEDKKHQHFKWDRHIPGVCVKGVFSSFPNSRDKFHVTLVDSDKLLILQESTIRGDI